MQKAAPERSARSVSRTSNTPPAAASDECVVARGKLATQAASWAGWVPVWSPATDIVVGGNLAASLSNGDVTHAGSGTATVVW